jgi:hypothetical protein
VLAYSSTDHTLTDASYGVTGTAGSWARGSLTSSRTVLTNVTQRVDSSGGLIAVFQYFVYALGSSNTGGAYWFIHDGATSDPGTPGASPAAAQPLAITGNGLTPTQAADTVEIVINLSVGADAETLNSPSLTAVNDQVNDAISLRLTSPPDEVNSASTSGVNPVPDGYGPCE